MQGRAVCTFERHLVVQLIQPIEPYRMVYGLQ